VRGIKSYSEAIQGWTRPVARALLNHPPPPDVLFRTSKPVRLYCTPLSSPEDVRPEECSSGRSSGRRSSGRFLFHFRRL